VSSREILAVAPEEGPSPIVTSDPESLISIQEDASHFPGGHAFGLVRPSTEAEIAQVLRMATRNGQSVLVVGAQSSLTGGAVPFGDLVISMSRMDRVHPVRGTGEAARVRVGAGVMLESLCSEVEAQGYYYPPAPTYQVATIGGTVATNASGSATFKYGPTRPWIKGLRVLTVDGWLLDIPRGRYQARRGEFFTLILPDGSRRDIPLPEHTMPRVKKVSMGYPFADPLDLIDLFIGSEGSLGVITEIDVGLTPAPPATLSALVFTSSESLGFELAASLRQSAERCHRKETGQYLDVRAIEHMDESSLELIRSRDVLKRLKIPVPADAKTALYLEIELPQKVPDQEILDELELTLSGSSLPTATSQFFRLLEQHGVIDQLELALPGEPSRREAFREIREAVPTAVNELIAERKARLDSGIHKLAGDMCVPVEHFSEFAKIVHQELDRRGLEYAIFGHISDGNVHPNILARSMEEMVAGKEALMAIADHVKEMGGSPLAEHGVGRNPTKQELLARYLGPEGLARMRAIKAAFDPDWRLARGVLFSSPPGPPSL